MTDFQWRVIVALCRIVLDLKHGLGLSYYRDIDTLHQVVEEYENKDKKTE